MNLFPFYIASLAPKYDPAEVLSVRGMAISQLTNPFTMNIGSEAAVMIKMGNFEFAVACKNVLPNGESQKAQQGNYYQQRAADDSAHGP